MDAAHDVARPGLLSGLNIQRKTAYLEGTVPPTAPLRRYKLSHLEQCFHMGAKAERNVTR